MARTRVRLENPGRLPTKSRSAFGLILSAFVILALFILGGEARAELHSHGEEIEATLAETETPEEFQVIEAVLERVNLPALKDAYTASNRPNTNWGGDENLAVGYQLSDGDPGALRTFIQFDFPGSIPTDATINRARIRLYQRSAIGLDQMRIVVHQPSGPWDEFNLTWSNQPGFAGDERASVFVDSTTGYKEWDITELVKEWKSGATPNYGVIIEGLEEVADNRRLFYSRHTGDSALRPILMVDYTPSGTIPPPSSSFLHPVNPYQMRADFRVEWRADDPSGTGIAYFDVQVREPGQEWRAWQAGTSATHAVYVGEHGRTYEFRVRAVNQAGIAEPFPAEAQARTTVDLVAPVVTVNSLPAFTNQQLIQVTWTGFDDVSGVRNYDVQIRYGASNWVDAITGTTQTAYTLPGQEGVPAQVRVRARDHAGNLSSYDAPGATVSTTLDTTPPRACVVRFVPSVLPSVTAFSVSWLGDDGTGSGVGAFDVEYRFNGGPWLPFQSGVTFTTASFSPVSGAGLYEFRARARDVLGNQGQFRATGADASILVGVELPAPDFYLPLISILSTDDEFLARCRVES